MKIHRALFIVAVVLAGALPLAADPAVVTDQLTHESIAAIVDDEIITTSQIESQAAPTIAILRQNLTGTELVESIRKAKLNVIKALIDRLLILHEFTRNGGTIPDAEVQGLIDERIKDLYAGNKPAFAAALTDHDETLEEYKEDISDSLTIDYMRAKFVTERVKAMKPANAYENDAFTHAVQDSWINTLYGKSYVKNFYAYTGP